MWAACVRARGLLLPSEQTAWSASSSPSTPPGGVSLRWAGGRVGAGRGGRGGPPARAVGQMPPPPTHGGGVHLCTPRARQPGSAPRVPFPRWRGDRGRSLLPTHLSTPQGQQGGGQGEAGHGVGGGGLVESSNVFLALSPRAPSPVPHFLALAPNGAPLRPPARPPPGGLGGGRGRDRRDRRLADWPHPARRRPVAG